MGVGGEECQKHVMGYLEVLAERIREALEGVRNPPLLAEVVHIAKQFVRKHGGCERPVDLEEEYRSVAKLALDFSMEALSRHMESLPEDVYSLISGAMTAYAVHIAKLVTIVIEEAERLGGFAPFFLEASEVLVFAAASRMYALSILLRRMDSSEIAKKADKIKWLIDVFVAEDSSYFKSLYSVIYGGGAG